MIKLVTGDEPMIQEALGYLQERYGMPKEDIKRLEIDAETGQPMRLTVTLVVREPAEVKVEPLGLSEQQRNVSDMNEAIDRWANPDRPRPFLRGPNQDVKPPVGPEMSEIVDPATFAREHLGKWTSDAWENQ